MPAMTYKQYRQRCEALEKQLEELQDYPPKNIHQDSIDYLLTTAETFLSAASSLIEMRERIREAEDIVQDGANRTLEVLRQAEEARATANG